MKDEEKLLIILGDKYKFNILELPKLQKKYSIINLSYNGNSKEAIRNIQDYIKFNNSKILVLNTDIKIPKELSNYLTKLQSQKYQIISIEDFLEKYFNKLYISPAHTINIKSYTKWQYIQKRAIDYSIAIPLGLVTLPIMLYSAYRIKKESPDGPVFFTQTRVGKNEKKFKCYKFRSMHEKTEYFNHYTQDDDPRIFTYGNFMRKTRIDELPQLLNVIKGDMHLVGPRAEWIDLVKNYESQLPNYHTRHKVAPGITGWAQVNYPYGQNLEDTRQKLMYDLYYIKHWSLWLEIKTIFKTVSVVLGKKGI